MESPAYSVTHSNLIHLTEYTVLILLVVRRNTLGNPCPLSYNIFILVTNVVEEHPRCTDMLFGSLSDSVGYYKQHTALCEWHTRQQDSSQLGLLCRSQARTHDRQMTLLSVGSSETQGMFPFLHFVTD